MEAISISTWNLAPPTSTSREALQTSFPPDSTCANSHPASSSPRSRIPASCSNSQPASSEDQGKTVFRSVAARHWPVGILLASTSFRLYPTTRQVVYRQFDKGPAWARARGSWRPSHSESILRLIEPAAGERITNILSFLKIISLHNSTLTARAPLSNQGSGCTIGPALSSCSSQREPASRSSQPWRLRRGGRPRLPGSLSSGVQSSPLSSLFRNSALLNGLEPQSVTLLTCFYIVSCHSFFDLTFQTLLFLRFPVFLPYP